PAGSWTHPPRELGFPDESLSKHRLARARPSRYTVAEHLPQEPRPRLGGRLARPQRQPAPFEQRESYAADEGLGVDGHLHHRTAPERHARTAFHQPDQSRRLVGGAIGGVDHRARSTSG